MALTSVLYIQNPIAEQIQASDSADIHARVTTGAHSLGVAGQKDDALRLIRQVEEEAKGRYFCPYEIATAYVSLGDFDTACEWFKKGIAGRADCMAWLGMEPWMDPFHADPRWAAFVKDIGLTPIR